MKYYTHINSVVDSMIDDITYIKRERVVNKLLNKNSSN